MVTLQAAEEAVSATLIQLLGAGGFGAIIGWYVYYINRYRAGEVSWTDLTTLIGIIGGGAIISIFPARSDLFGAYGIGLFTGFFAYYLVLVITVSISKNFTSDWFLDGRRRNILPGEIIPGSVRQTVTAMAQAERVEDKDNID